MVEDLWNDAIMTTNRFYGLKDYIKGWSKSFAVQLILLHLRNRIFFLLPWVFMILWTLGVLHFDYGIPFLFLVPEYLGKENVTSYILVGFSMGVYIMVWHITTYLLESYKFPFMANLRHPFAMFCINNSIIPLLYYVIYFFSLLKFDRSYFDSNLGHSLIMFTAFVLGSIIAIVMVAYYFSRTNSNVYRFMDQAVAQGNNVTHSDKLSYKIEEQNKWHVETYFSLRFKTRPTRQVRLYDVALVSQVFKQHHYNFFLAQVTFILILIIVGFFVEYDVAQIPAACSLVLALALLTSVLGLFKFWTGRWSTAVFVLFFVGINYAYKLGFSTHENKAYGLNYNHKVSYSYATFDSLSKKESYESDKQNTIDILNKWKLKNIQAQNKGKPKMVILMASGGGLSSALFTSRVVQICNESLDNNLFNQTALMTGASGGIIGLTYMRELYINQTVFGNINQTKYARDIAGDLLNPMCLTNLTHDVFFPLQTITYQNQLYKKDRSYLFEWKLNKNAHGLFSKKISDNEKLEKRAMIPLLFNNATIVNDYKQIVIAAQPVRYLMKPKPLERAADKFETDMIDFCSMFQNAGGNTLKLSTVVRINATYPLILPSVNLPTRPEISAIDGGMRDNNGAQIVYRFLDVFQDWIRENTCGVVVIQIKYFPKFKRINSVEKLSLIEKVTNPIGKIYSNIFELQDYEQDQLFNAANDFLEGKLKVIRFEYNEQNRRKEGSLSFHLTAKEKEDIINCAENEVNQKQYKRLAEEIQSLTP